MRLIVAILLFVFLSRVSTAEDTNRFDITIAGTTYHNAHWGRVTPATVTIFHSTGVADLPLSQLSPDLQKQFSYDQNKSREYLASQATQQRILMQKQSELAAQQRTIESQKMVLLKNQPEPVKPTLTAAPACFDIRFTDVTDFQKIKDGWYKATLTFVWGQKFEYEIAVIFPESGVLYMNHYMNSSRLTSTVDTYLEGVQIKEQTTDVITRAGTVYGHWLTPQEISDYGVENQGKFALLVGSSATKKMGGTTEYGW
jgi:hypothetical protein